MSTSNPNRQPAGVPTGGQFATSTRAESGVSLDPWTGTETPWHGSGYGDYIPGDQVVSIDQVQPGDLLTTQSEQFHSRNLLRVTRTDTDRGVFHGTFADPE